MDEKALEDAVQDIELICNRRLAEIMDQFGTTGMLTAFVNIGTSFIAKALIMTNEKSREPLLLTIQMLIDSRTREGDEIIESSLAITRAMGSTCRPH